MYKGEKMKSKKINQIIFTLLFLFILPSLLYADFPANVDFIFLIDVSGSMEFSLDGTTTNAGHPVPDDAPLPAGQDSWERIYYVKESLPIIGVLIDEILMAPAGSVENRRYAIAIFPGSASPASPDPITLMGIGETSSDLRDWNKPAFDDIIDNQLTTRWNGTPINRALHTAVNLWTGTPASNGKVLFLLTDGKEYDSASPGTPTLTGINLGVIQMGTGPETDLPFLQTIPGVAHLRSYILDAQNLETLTKEFVEAFFDGSFFTDPGEEYVVDEDPTFIMTNESIKTFEIDVTEYDKQLYFITSWHEPKNENKVTFFLKTSGNTLTPEIVKTIDDVSYREGSTFAMYIINPGYLEQNQGKWQGIIDGRTLAPETEQVTDYIVGGPSRLLVRPYQNTSPGIKFTGDSLIYTFNILIGDTVLKNLDTELELSRPATPLGNWFAYNKLTQVELDCVRNLKFSGTVSDAFKKYFYLKNSKAINLPTQVTDTLKLSDDGKHNDKEENDGIYGVVLENVSQPGIYESRLLAQGKTPKDQNFTREFTQTHVVEPHIEGQWDFSELEIIEGKLSEKYRTYKIIFTPKDRFGNYLIPGQRKHINIQISGEHEFITKLEDDLQGSYISNILILQDNANPVITISYKDIQFPPHPLIDRPKCFALAVMPYAGQFYIDDNLNIKDSFIYGLKFRTCLCSGFELEVAFGTVSTEDSLGIDGKIFDASAALLWKLPELGFITPYVSSGGGWLKFQDFSSEDNGKFIHVGAGIDIRVSKNIAFNIEAKNQVAFDLFANNRTQNLKITAGIMWTIIPN